MAKLNQYNQETAEAYSKLGIIGTTYQAAFEEAANMLGDLTGKVYLDFGSGTGRSAMFLKNLGAEQVIGIDNNLSMVEMANADTEDGIEFHLVKENIPFLDNSFDGAFCSFVFMEMENLDEINNAIREICRVLKPGGHFLLIVASEESARGHDYVSFHYPDKPKKLKSGDITKIIIKGRIPFTIEDHFWAEQDYVDSLENNGFEIEELYYPLPKTGKWRDELNAPPHLIIRAKKAH